MSCMKLKFLEVPVVSMVCGVVKFLYDVLLYSVLGAVWYFHSQMVEYDNEV